MLTKTQPSPWHTDGKTNAETAAMAADPRTGRVYLTTLQSTSAPNPATPGVSTYQYPTCFIRKRIVVYYSDDNGANWNEFPGTRDLPQDDYTTDPGLAISSDGWVHLVFMRWIRFDSCADPDPASVDWSRVNVTVWVAPPNGPLRPAFTNPAVAGRSDTGDGVISFGSNPGDVSLMEGIIDRPVITANPRQNQIVVRYISYNPGNVQNPGHDRLVTLNRNDDGTYSIVASMWQNSRGTHANVAFDDVGSGRLYVLTSDLYLSRFTWDPNSGWTTSSTEGGFVPSSALASHVNGNARLLRIGTGSAQVLIRADPVPALSVIRFASASDPVILTAMEDQPDPNNSTSPPGTSSIVLLAANSNDLGAWTTAAPVPLPSGAIAAMHPVLGADPNTGLLNLVTYVMDGSATAPSLVGIKTWMYVYSPGDLANPLARSQLNSAPPSLADFARRHPGVPNVGVPANDVFIGDYTGIASISGYAITSYPELGASGQASIDLGVAVRSFACGSPLELAAPDSLWECSNCSCADKSVAVVGCLPPTVTSPAAACESICPRFTCGTSLTCCGTNCTASSAPTGRLLSTNSCAQSNGPPPGGYPASMADYVAVDNGHSTVTASIGGQTTTTNMEGRLYVNVASSPPAAGSVIEIARADFRPGALRIPAYGIRATDIVPVERMRMRGRFTDTQHFTIDAGLGQFAISTTVMPDTVDSTTPPFPTKVLVSNSAPITGFFNAAAGVISLAGSFGDATGNEVEVAFSGTLVSHPTDSNNDGIIDVCPGQPLPDTTPPVFTHVPPTITITRCTGAAIGIAQATDASGVTITNDAPATFPLGKTVVTWTARDGAGNSTVATQTVFAELGDDTSCCPAGSNIILGTPNDDVLTGTTARDCILGLGGQDRLSGLGGDDALSGGDGDDVLSGGEGNDSLFGGSGQDTLSGDAGDDSLSGGDGDDLANGQDGSDSIFGGQGQDELRGGNGNDLLDGGDGDDRLYGEAGSDLLYGGPGNDPIMQGGAGDDQLFGQEGDDLLDGGPDGDHLDGGPGHNGCIGGGGADVFALCDWTQ